MGVRGNHGVPGAGAGADPAASRRQSPDTVDQRRPAARGAGTDDRRSAAAQQRDVLDLVYTWAQRRRDFDGIRERGLATRRSLDDARSRLAAADPEDRKLTARLRQSVSKLEARRERLLTEYREAQAVVGDVDTRLREAGVDPATINYKAALRAGRKITAPAPASGQQLEFLTEMLSRRGISPAAVDDTLTTGEATRAIKTALTGKQPALRSPEPDPPAQGIARTDAPRADQDPAPTPAAAAAETAAAESAAATEAVRTRVLDTIAGHDAIRKVAAVSVFALYHGAAYPQVCELTTLALGDVIENSESPAQRRAARELLADPATLSQLAQQATEAVWHSQHTPDPARQAAQELGERIAAEHAATGLPAAGVQATIFDAAIGAESELARQSTVQDAIDVATTATTVDWHALGRAAFDPATVLLDADPSSHPQVVAALAELRADSPIVETITDQFTLGYNSARTAHCEPACNDIVDTLLADPDVRAAVRAHDPDQIGQGREFENLLVGKLDQIAVTGDLVAAAIAELRYDEHLFSFLLTERLRTVEPDPLGEVDAPVTASAVDHPADAVHDADPDTGAVITDPGPEPTAEPTLLDGDAPDVTTVEETPEADPPAVEVGEPPVEDIPAAATASEEPSRDGALPQVAQDESGVPLSKWGSTALVEAERPDGSRVYIDAATLVPPAPATESTPEPGDTAVARSVEVDEHPVDEHAVDNDTEPDETAQVDEEPPASVETVRSGEATDFVLGTQVLVPISPADRIAANIEAIRLLARLDEAGRYATADEQAVLAQFSGWGGAWQVFDTAKTEHEPQREQLRALLGDREFRAARQSTANAHYTDPAVVAVMWDALVEAGLPEDANVLEPGCGAGHFLGHAPGWVNAVGVEVDPTTARIAHYLYPSREVRNHGFERDFSPTARYDAAIGNVPFGDYSLYDDKFNPNGLSVHNYFIKKSLALTQPGGYVAVITSTFTSDARREAARREIAELGDLVGAVRLPSKAFARQAATDVVTDVLVFRRREPDRAHSPETNRWIEVNKWQIDGKSVTLNDYFGTHREHILGTVEVGSGMYGQETLLVHGDDTRPLADQLRHALRGIIDRARDNDLALSTTPLPGVVTPGLDRGQTLSAVAIPGTLRWDEATESFDQYVVGDGWEPAYCNGRARAQQWLRMLDMGDTVMALSEASRTESTFEARQELRDRLNAQYDDYVATYGALNRYKWTTHRERNDEQQARTKFGRLEQKWRLNNGEPLINEYGEPVLGDDGKVIKIPAEGSLPDHIAEELLEQSYEPDQKPYKKRSQFEGAIKLDPRIAMVRALEHYDDDTHVARKASIFTEDAARFHEPAERADNVDEALAICFDERGRIEPARIAELLDLSVAEALEQAAGKIFPDLDHPGEWVIAPRFLSGNVREKLAKAKLAAAEDPQLHGPSVAALTDAIPPDVDLTKISIRPGAEWLGVDTYREFFQAEFDLGPHDISIEFSPISGSWQIETKRHPLWAAPDTGYRDAWGLESADISGVELFEMIANNKAVQSAKTGDELMAAPKPRFHPERTELLRAKAVQLEETFSRWLWADPERADRLTRRFNDALNSFNRVQYPTEHKTFPGLNPKYVPYDYQAQAVVRQLHEETILLDHCVGAGKTLTIAMTCMEMRRLGQVRQPWIVVPNFLVDQWHREVLDAYPSANILVATDLDGPPARQRFIAQTAVGDWDMVIVPQSVFGLIGVSNEYQATYIEKQIKALEDRLEEAKLISGGEQTHSVKQIAKAIEREKSRHSKLIKGKSRDTGLTFEQSGADFLFVDEAHLYKNLTRASASEDLALIDGSLRSSDLEMKALLLRDRAEERNRAEGRPFAPARAMSFATGTPVSNSLGELWVMKRFLRPDLLAKAGMSHIDAWAQTFAQQRTTVEMNITGSSLRPVSRMAEYNNMPQLLAMLDQFRDVVTQDRIPAELPTLKDGKRTVVEFELSQQVRDFMHDLDARMAQTTGKTMHIDNALKIGSDGLNASLYPPLANLPEPDPDNNRIAITADILWRIHSENAEVFTPADKAGPDATGVFQLVFCDRGTPKATDHKRTQNLYTRLRDELVARGMREEEIAFIHHYPSARAKQQLFADCRAGRIRVLIGSTEKMGVGMNVQRLAKSLVHLSVPYRASDLAQREGRIIRQGNRMSEVEIISPVAVKSYDGTSWQIIERKAHIDTYLRSADCPTTIEDVGGDMAVSAAQTKAAATGDPVYIAAVEKEAEVKALRAEQTMIAQAAASRAHTVLKLEQSLPIREQELRELDAMVEPLSRWRAADREDRVLVINGRTYPARDTSKIAEGVQDTLSVLSSRRRYTDEPLTFFEIEGVPVYAYITRTTQALVLTMDGGLTRVIAATEADKADDWGVSVARAHGIVQRVHNMIDDAIAKREPAAEMVEEVRRRIETLSNEADREFTRGDELVQAEHDLAAMKARISAQENSPAALHKRAADFDRRQSMGQYQGWTLDLNPTEGRADDLGIPRDSLKELVPVWMNDHASAWKARAGEREAARRADPWQPASSDGSRYQYGGLREDGEPGASVEWTGEDWHWIAWDGQGNTDNSVMARRDAAQQAARGALVAMLPAEDPAHAPNSFPAHTEPEPDVDVAKQRLELRRRGEQVAQDRPDWTAHLGPVPTRPADREDWINTAGQLALARENAGIPDTDTSLMGPRPEGEGQAGEWDRLTEHAAELRAAAAQHSEHEQPHTPDHHHEQAQQHQRPNPAPEPPASHLAPSI
ncbi:helicase [Nocardia neocaledoniensis]|uniref:helicase n=1 Tax=Nocardia neocaledoniensis TaxID=236511 RepID=UPI002455A1BD|nr:helicase [Nocardia neocaledoniensis]